MDNKDRTGYGYDHISREFKHEYKELDLSDINVKIERGSYYFENPELPLEFKTNNNGKEILSIKNSIISRCDVKFWNQCSPDNEEYGLKQYNKRGNESKYINTNTLEDLFYN